MIYGGHFDIDSKLKRIKDLEKIQNEVDFWNNREKSEQVIKEIKDLKNITDHIERVKKEYQDNNDLLELSKEDESFLEEVDTKTLKDNISSLEILLLLNSKYDDNDCIFEIHSGAGGTEACDWANMLYRMYTRYFEKKNYKVEVISYQEGEEVGIKSVTLSVKGKYAYGYLKCEKGVHRLVRLSPFDAANKRHTSFASVDVTPYFTSITDIEIDEKDLKIDVYRSSGCGGQGVNTTDSAVRITHLPTKIVVTCQNERSQIKNKEIAMSILKGKLKLIEIEKQNQELKDVKGELSNIEFGSQIRSYVLHPYSMIKDHRTNYETSNVTKVLDGDLDPFIESYLKEIKNHVKNKEE